MIYDTLNNLPNYLGMSDNLDAVIEWRGGWRIPFRPRRQ